jgi:S1-C subfamily serine protease
VTNSHVARNCGSLTTASGTALKPVLSDDRIDLALLQAAGINPPVIATFRQDDAALGELVTIMTSPTLGDFERRGIPESVFQ